MELSIDTASEMASVGLSEEGVLVAEITWRCRRNHTVELLPSVARLLKQAGRGKDGLAALFVCVGPGMYTGLRVGVATAKGLATALGLPLLGVGRLELDAYQQAAFPGTVVAVHRAGRGELAWAAYETGPWREAAPPQLSGPEVIVTRLRPPALVAGEIDGRLRAELERLEGIRIAASAASIRRAATLAELGYRRLAAGEAADAALVRAVYLRPPAIGPQPSR
jgi:tRNA threonylcarbamoyladenosine biosynthesis protein TsaB